MRPWALVPVLLAHSLLGQVRINELQCARSPGSDGKGANGDWVELYNVGTAAVDMAGSAFVIDGVSHKLKGPLMIAPRSRRVLWCDGDPKAGTDHLELKLPRTGGTLLLVAADKVSVLDLFHWPAMPAGCSIGRKEDGGRAWGFFDRPGPGAANNDRFAADKVLETPLTTIEKGRLRIDLPQGASEVRYTLDSSDPDERSAVYATPLAASVGTVVRARAFAPGAIASGEAVFASGIPTGAWSLVIAPSDLQGPNGIADVPSGNFSRSGLEWQRQAWLQNSAGNGSATPVGVAIAGSGTRSLAKRNFKVFAKDRFGATDLLQSPDGSAYEEMILRADASPNAFLRNEFMNEVARRSGGNVDVQQANAMPLYLNGEYQGLYRSMPAKNKAWAKDLNAGKPVELVDGAGPRAVSGGLKNYVALIQAMAADAGAEALDSIVDLNSLIDLACFDLWSGRGDHDLNVRCWRPRSDAGKWRWVLYDMDQWAPPEERTVQRLCATAVPETPFVPQLLNDPDLRNRLLARMSALLATTLSADRTAGLLDSLYDQHAEDMAQDYARWHDELEMPTSKAAKAEIADHLKGRNAPLMAQLRQTTGLKSRSITVAIEPAGAGTVLLENLPLTDDQRTVESFANVALHLLAVPATGMEFMGWKNAENTAPTLVLSGQRDERAVAVFRPSGSASKNALKQ
ncbi:MAG: CotH kinase family protein [Flavobacteriales bacterium]|jgi:hypothetical protein|nr:CotH kinase family protein [Flavobacteriales bacterium]